MESLTRLLQSGITNFSVAAATRLHEDDQIHREISVNPSALHVTNSYQQFPRRKNSGSLGDGDDNVDDIVVVDDEPLPKVLILFCGGTLIMHENDDGFLVVNDKDVAIELLLNMEPKLKDIAQLDVHYIDNIDSSNMSPTLWDAIGAVIDNQYDAYAGFVITHGTDTMAYTASALSFVLQDLGKPVVMTGAQIPGSRIETDARRNFVNAVRVALLDRAGVMLVFDGDIILGARSHKISESKLDAFAPINWGLHGEVRIDIRFSNHAKARHDRPLDFQPGFETNIAVYTLFPGFPCTELMASLERGGMKGVVLNAYGSGNISYHYLNAITLARSKGIPVVVTTQCLEGATLMHLYDVGRQALNCGAIQAYDMSKECIVTKLMWALKRTTNLSEIQAILHTNFTGEINIEGKLYGAKT
jgi:L-asparaginase